MTNYDSKGGSSYFLEQGVQLLKGGSKQARGVLEILIANGAS